MAEPITGESEAKTPVTRDNIPSPGSFASWLMIRPIIREAKSPIAMAPMASTKYLLKKPLPFEEEEAEAFFPAIFYLPKDDASSV